MYSARVALCKVCCGFGGCLLYLQLQDRGWSCLAGQEGDFSGLPTVDKQLHARLWLAWAPASTTHGSIPWALGPLGTLSSTHRHHQQRAAAVCAPGTHGFGLRHENVAQVPLGLSKIFSGFCAWEVR